MPFPATSILDDFNAGATQNLTARAGWNAGKVWSVNSTLQTDAVPTYAKGTTSFNDNYWDTPTADGEVWMTFGSTGLPSTAVAFLFARISNPGGSTPTMYVVEFNTDGFNSWRIIKVIAGVGTVLSSTITQAISAGDSVGFEFSGTALASYYKASAGSWGAANLSITDSAITGSGYFGLEIDDATQRVDAFGGGSVAAVSSSAVQFLHGLPGGTSFT